MLYGHDCQGSSACVGTVADLTSRPTCLLLVRAPTANGISQEQDELRADPAALAAGAYDAPTKKGLQAEAASHGPASSGPSHPSNRQSGSSQQDRQTASRQTDGNADVRTANRTDSKQSGMNGLSSRPGQPGPGAVGDRPPSPASESSNQRAADLLQLREALQTLPPSFAEAISRHVSCTNEALQKAEAERRAMMRSLTAAQSQLATLPQMQVCLLTVPLAHLACQSSELSILDSS